MNKKVLLGFVVIVGMASYHLYEKHRSNAEQDLLSARMAANSIAMEQGWLNTGMDGIANMVNSLDQQFEVINDHEVNNQHTTEAKFYFSLSESSEVKCKVMKYQWTDRNMASNTKNILLSSENC